MRSVGRLREALAVRRSAGRIRAVAATVCDGAEVRALCRLSLDDDAALAYRAAWTLCHLPAAWNGELCAMRDGWTDGVLRDAAPGLRRVRLALLARLPQPDVLRVDLLDFCLERMMSAVEAPAVRMYCVKIAHAMCRTEPDLRRELRLCLEALEPDLLPPSVRAVRRSVLGALERGR